MQTKNVGKMPQIVRKHEPELLSDWLKFQLDALGSKASTVGEPALKRTCEEFLTLFVRASEQSDDIQSEDWKGVRELLAELSRSRAVQGYSPSETAVFILSLKQPIFEKLSSQITNAGELSSEIWTTTKLIDDLGLFTTSIYSRSKEEIIKRQQRELLELSTPVFRLWDKVLAVPLIGTLDSQRTQMIMESLLTQIVETGSKVAILDITGVPTVDTETAQHLIKTVSAARLMGAECIISGIRPQIAQTIVHLGIDIFDVTTKATMADAVSEALAQVGWSITRTADASGR